MCVQVWFTYFSRDTLDPHCDLKFNATVMSPETKELLLLCILFPCWQSAEWEMRTGNMFPSMIQRFGWKVHKPALCHLISTRSAHFKRLNPEKMKTALSSHNTAVTVNACSLTDMFMFVWKRCVCVCVCVGGGDGSGRTVALQKY